MILHYSTEVSIHVSDNLEDVLSQIGMNANDIALAKSKVLRPAYPNDLYTPLPDRQTTFTCIPTDKIIGTTRSTPGQSVFDNVYFVPDSKRHSDKFKRYFGELSRYGSLDSTRKSFAIQIDPVDVNYYTDSDEYFVERDGNHRALTAMLIGAPYIKARVHNLECFRSCPCFLSIP